MWNAVLLILSCLPSGDPEAWPGFLGAGHSVIATESIPLTWSPTQNVAWKAAVTGFGQSSPVIWNDRAYVSTVDGPLKDNLIVTAIALDDGHVLWTKSLPTSDPVKNGTFVSRAAPTPVVDAERVYCFFESGDVVAISHSGELAWHESLSKKYGKFDNDYGLAASPVQTTERVFVLVDHFGESYLTALSKADGQEIWRTKRDSRGSWTSPMMITIEGEPQVVCSSAGTIDGYSPASGEQLWTHSGVGGNRICSPWNCGNGVFLVGSQTSREFPDEGIVKQSNFALQVTRTDGRWTPSVAWKTEAAVPGMASPMEHAGYAYWINRQGVVFCFDVKTGEQKYAERVPQSPWATPLGLGDRLYIFGKDGLTTVLKTGPVFEKLAENQLWDPDIAPDQSLIDKETDPKRKAGAAMHAKPEIMGVAAISGTLLIRTGNQVFCVRP